MTTEKIQYTENGTEIKVNRRFNIEPGAFATNVPVATEVTIPEGYVGILAIREKYGNLGLNLTAPILWSGFKGIPKLHIDARGASSTVEVSAGYAIAHIAVVKAYEGEQN